MNVAYDFHSLVKGGAYLIYDTQGRSAFINPRLTYSFTQRWDLSTGWQAFTGKDASEFGALPDLYFLEIKNYF